MPVFCELRLSCCGCLAPLGRSREDGSIYGCCLDWGGGKGALGHVCAYLAEVLSCIASPLLKELQLVGQKMVNLDCSQISFPSALYGLCISFQICV